MKKILVLKYPEFANGPAIGNAIARRYELQAFYPSSYLAELMAAGDPLGEQLRPFSSGELKVPDELVLAAAEHFLDNHGDAAGYLFSYFPYLAEQADWLDGQLAARGLAVTLCLGFDPGQVVILETLDQYVEVTGATRESELDRYSKSMEYFLEVTSHYKAQGTYRNIRGWFDVENLLGPPTVGRVE